MLDHRHIMGNEDVRNVPLLLDVLEKIQNLRLDGDVQCGDRFVADDKPGLQGQGPGHADALPPAAAQFVGIGEGETPGQAHRVHQVIDTLLQFLPVPAEVIGPQRVSDQLGHTESGVQRGKRVLENDLHVFAQGLAPFPLGGGNIFPVKIDFPGGGVQKTQNHPAQRGFAAARFTHDTQCLSLLHAEGHIIDGVENAAGGLKILLQSLHPQQFTHPS